MAAEVTAEVALGHVCGRVVWISATRPWMIPGSGSGYSLASFAGERRRVDVSIDWRVIVGIGCGVDAAGRVRAVFRGLGLSGLWRFR